MGSTTKQLKRNAASVLGQSGGKAIAKKLGNKGMQKLGKRGAKARWGNKARSNN